MLAGRLPPRVGHIIAERPPVLRVILDALTAADQANEGTADLLVEVGSLDDVGIRGTRLAPIVLEADGRFVEPAPAGVPMLSDPRIDRSEEHTSELQSQSISYAVFCLKKKNKPTTPASTAATQRRSRCAR